jgi:hypothetical protein
MEAGWISSDTTLMRRLEPPAISLIQSGDKLVEDVAGYDSLDSKRLCLPVNADHRDTAHDSFHTSFLYFHAQGQARDRPTLLATTEGFKSPFLKLIM